MDGGQSAIGQERNGDDGFTLIEVMVVVWIIAILIGIAIPALLGSRRRAEDVASKANLRNALGSAQTIFTDHDAYLATGPMVTSLGADEPGLTFQDDATPSTADRQMSLAISASTGSGTLDTIVLATKSGSGTCWYYRHVAAPGLPSSGTFYAAGANGTACQASNAPAAAASWTAQ